MLPSRRIIITAAVLLFCGIAAVVYGMFDPAETVWFPRCPILTFTGLKCPGCGSQRMLHALLHADIAAAWHYNAVLLLTLPLIVLLIVSEALREKMPRLYTALNSNAVIAIVLIIMVLWTITRNLFGW